MTTCERHEQIRNLEKKGKNKEQIYQALRWVKCTCEPHRIWCDYCRGSAVCLRCRNRDGKPRNKNYIYCTWCGGNGKCMECNEIGEMIK